MDPTVHRIPDDSTVPVSCTEHVETPGPESRVQVVYLRSPLL